MIKIAIYDMDRTVTRAPTWTGFLLSTAKARSPWRLLLVPAAVVAALGYVAHVIDRGTLKQVTQRLMLGRSLSPAAAASSASAFAERMDATNVLQGARDRLAADRAEGYRLVMATASYRFYAAEIAARLGFDDVIATDSVVDDLGALQPRILGENCYGPAKLKMVEAWLAAEGIAREDASVRFYSDHVSDAPTLEWADEAFAVNAHGPLRMLAKAKGWTIFDWE